MNKLDRTGVQDLRTRKLHSGTIWITSDFMGDDGEWFQFETTS